MRYAIIGDIHGNLAAFKAVLDDIQVQGGADKVWCLGDIVGYGPDPHECIELLRQLDHTCVAGNHDWGSAGKVKMDSFNPDAMIACDWTAKRLTTEDIQYLENLPLTAEEDGFTIVHGSPREPILEYITTASIAKENFSRFRTRYCLAGHSHSPLVFIRQRDGSCSAGEFTPIVKLALGASRLIINPGSVGQPRDGNPQASYAIYDSQLSQIRNYRVGYDVSMTQDRMAEMGLPMRMLARLQFGR
ncbi:metallophosphoesterase family protein [Chloroflexota bacterium]